MRTQRSGHEVADAHQEGERGDEEGPVQPTHRRKAQGAYGLKRKKNIKYMPNGRVRPSPGRPWRSQPRGRPVITLPVHLWPLGRLDVCGRRSIDRSIVIFASRVGMSVGRLFQSRLSPATANGTVSALIWGLALGLGCHGLCAEADWIFFFLFFLSRNTSRLTSGRRASLGCKNHVMQSF